MYTEFTKCGNCPFHFIGPITKIKRCLLLEESIDVNVDDDCFIENGNVVMNNDVARDVLIYHNDWRRGADCTQISPRLIGMAIEYAITKLKNT